MAAATAAAGGGRARALTGDDHAVPGRPRQWTWCQPPLADLSAMPDRRIERCFRDIHMRNTGGHHGRLRPVRTFGRGLRASNDPRRTALIPAGGSRLFDTQTKNVCALRAIGCLRRDRAGSAARPGCPRRSGHGIDLAHAPHAVDRGLRAFEHLCAISRRRSGSSGSSAISSA